MISRKPAAHDATTAVMCVALRLHRHAQESVFAFCSLCELAAVCAVAREWRAAVGSMAPLQFHQQDCGDDRALQICASPLSRHVNAIRGRAGSNDAVPTCALLQPLSQRMPHLRSLRVSVRLPIASPLAFPARLQQLYVEISCAAGASDERLTAGFNETLAAIAELAHLEKFFLAMPRRANFWPDCSLAALALLPSLRSLHLVVSAVRLSDKQVAELRALGHLDEVQISPMTKPLMCRLLATPHTLRWRYFDGFTCITEEMAPLLTSLPLRILEGRLDTPNCDFLAQMPQLTKLLLHYYGRVTMDAERVLSALGQCVQLRVLSLQAPKAAFLPFTSAQLGTCLARLSRLRSLRISSLGGLTTLACLTQGRLPRTLTSLILCGFDRRLPLAEWRHLLQLSALRSLSLWGVFDEQLSAEDQALLTPPSQSPLLPQLANFRCKWETPRWWPC